MHWLCSSGDVPMLMVCGHSRPGLQMAASAGLDGRLTEAELCFVVMEGSRCS